MAALTYFPLLPSPFSFLLILPLPLHRHLLSPPGLILYIIHLAQQRTAHTAAFGFLISLFLSFTLRSFFNFFPFSPFSAFGNVAQRKRRRLRRRWHQASSIKHEHEHLYYTKGMHAK